MGVTLRERKNKDGSTTLFLDIIHNGIRQKEYLSQLKLIKATTQADKTANKTNKDLAKKIAIQRAAQLQANDYDMNIDIRGKAEVLSYWDGYISRYTKKDKRNMEGARNAFSRYLVAAGIKTLSMKAMTEMHVRAYADHLAAHQKGEGVHSYFSRFKKMMKQAMREKVLTTNPSAEVSVRRDTAITKKVLTLDEIQALAATPTLNDELKRAFLFSCFTGLRWVDVKALQWRDLDFANMSLSLTQAKTGLNVTAPLHETAVALLPEKGKPDEKVFKLPSHNGALDTLDAWVKRAGIEKKITWHCARHSFATNLFKLKADILTISKLLGHTSLSYTQRYTRVADEQKRAAIDSMPALDLGLNPEKD